MDIFTIVSHMTDERINEPEERSGENVQNAAERER
jgi:hypothetical protein